MVIVSFGTANLIYALTMARSFVHNVTTHKLIFVMPSWLFMTQIALWAAIKAEKIERKKYYERVFVLISVVRNWFFDVMKICVL